MDLIDDVRAERLTMRFVWVFSCGGYAVSAPFPMKSTERLPLNEWVVSLLEHFLDKPNQPFPRPSTPDRLSLSCRVVECEAQNGST